MRRRLNEPENELEKRSRTFDKVVGFLHIFFIVFMTLLIIYLFFVQVIDVGKYRARARSQRVGRIFSMRGDIFDRNGIKLATDKVYSDVYAHPADYDHTPEELAKMLAPILKIPKNVLLQKIKIPYFKLPPCKNQKATSDLTLLLDQYSRKREPLQLTF